MMRPFCSWDQDYLRKISLQIDYWFQCLLHFSNSNPLGIFNSNGQQNTSRVGASGIIVVALAMSINSHEQTQ